MPDFRCIEPNGAKRELHHRAGTEGTDNRPDPHRPSQQPAGQGRRAEQSDAHQCDGKFLQALGQAYQKGVARAAAQRRHHIGVLRIGQYEQPRQHNRDRCHERLAGCHGMDPVEEVHRFSDYHRIDKHGDADGLFHQDVDDQDGKRYRNGSISVEDPEALGKPQVQHVPGRRADVGLDGQIDSKSVDKQADRRNQHIQKDCPG